MELLIAGQNQFAVCTYNKNSNYFQLSTIYKYLNVISIKNHDCFEIVFYISICVPVLYFVSFPGLIKCGMGTFDLLFRELA